MAEMNVPVAAPLADELRRAAAQRKLDEHEVWEHALLLGLYILINEDRAAENTAAPAEFADALQMELMDVQTRTGRLSYSRYELEHDLRIMEMRKSSIEIEIHGIRKAVARCEEVRRSMLDADPVVKSNGFSSKLRRKWNEFFGKKDDDPA